MQRQHAGNGAVLIGDKKTPALLDLERNARAQFRQQKIAGALEPGRDPAVHPEMGDLVMFVDAGGADHGLHRRGLGRAVLREMAPGISRVAVLWDPTTGASQVGATETAAQSLNIDLQVIEIANRDDLTDAFPRARAG